MSEKTRHIYITVVLTAYATVAFGWQLAVMSGMLNYALAAHEFHREKQSLPIDERPVWTSHKHLLPTERPELVPVPVASQEIFPPRHEAQRMPAVDDRTRLCTRPVSTASCRAPPLG